MQTLKRINENMSADIRENMDQLEKILTTKFGLVEFRRGQKEIISSVLAKKDVLAVLPTGGGKSLCYQLPSVLTNKLVLVISPLIALMKDQVLSLKQKGIAAGCLYAGQLKNEKTLIFETMKKGGCYILYLSPERVQKDGFKNWIKNQDIALFAIDEAHCVSQWGHDFREEYGALSVLKEMRPDVPVLALTASATPIVLSDLSYKLNLQKPHRHVHGFYRPNLYYQVEFCEDNESKNLMLQQALKQTPEGRVIVYCGTRKSTEEVANILSTQYEDVGFYHAGLTTEQRDQVQNLYHSGKLRILVATNAFGMGIDHPNVRLVVHYHMPANIDSLYQEMGRAGRDSKASTCLMLYSKKDKGLQSYFIQTSKAPQDIKNSRWNTLEALINYAEGSECRHAEILSYYRDSQRLEKCGHCDNCSPLSSRRIVKPSISTPSKTIKSFKKKEKHTTLILDNEQSAYFESLRVWRRNKARELDVPAFVILSDRTLKQLAVEKPTKVEQLTSIYGMGEYKVEKFGREIVLLFK